MERYRTHEGQIQPESSNSEEGEIYFPLIISPFTVEGTLGEYENHDELEEREELEEIPEDFCKEIEEISSKFSHSAPVPMTLKLSISETIVEETSVDVDETFEEEIVRGSGSGGVVEPGEGAAAPEVWEGNKKWE